MSRAGLRVVFPDGVVRCGIYNSTVDMAYPWLYDTDREAWDDNRPSAREYDEPPVGDVFDVIIYSDYGDGFWWRGMAAKNVITEGFEPWPDDRDVEVHDGMPEQVQKFYDEQRAIYEASEKEVTR